MKRRPKQNLKSAVTAIAIAAATVPAAQAAVAPSGPPIALGSIPDGQSLAGIARNTSGAFVVAEQGATATSDTIYVRAYDANGVAVTPQITISTQLGNLFTNVAMNESGAFVVTWGYLSVGDADNFVMAQEFSPTGTALGAATKVIELGGPVPVSSDKAVEYRVAMTSNGDFVLGWQLDTNLVTLTGSSCSNIPPGLNCKESESFQYSTYARVFDASGNAKTNVITVSQSPVLKSTFNYDFGPPASAYHPRGTPTVAMDSNGNFDVAYAQQNGSNQAIDWAAYDATGTVTHQATIASVSTSLLSNFPMVAMNDGGQSVVQWGQLKSSTASKALESLRLQQLNADGSLNGAAITLNSVTIADPTAKKGRSSTEDLKLDSQGNFASVWTAYDSTGINSLFFEQDYLAGGKANGAPVQLLPPTSGSSTNFSFVQMDDALEAMMITFISQSIGSDVQVQMYSSP